MPRISLVITAYDIESYLVECLESVLRQTLPDFEAIVVDDCSNDGTAELAESFAARDPRIRVIRREQNGGPGGARNTGFDVATGEFVAFIDGDDWLHEEMLERASAACIDADVPVCLLTFTYIWPTDQRLDYEVGKYDLPRRFRSNPDTILRMPVTPWSKLYRRDLLVESGIRFAERRKNEDAQFFFTLFAKMEPEVVKLDEHLYVYRGRPDSVGVLHERTGSEIPRMLDEVWTFYVENDLVDRYGPVMSRLLTEHLRGTMPRLDSDAQEPFYDGLRRMAIRLESGGLAGSFSTELADVPGHGYVQYLQRRHLDLQRLGRDPWFSFGQLPPKGRLKRVGRVALGKLGF